MGTDSNNLLVPLLCNKYAFMYILQFMNNWKCQISGYYLQHILGLTKNSLFSCGIISAIQYVLFSVFCVNDQKFEYQVFIIYSRNPFKHQRMNGVDVPNPLYRERETDEEGREMNPQFDLEDHVCNSWLILQTHK